MFEKTHEKHCSPRKLTQGLVWRIFIGEGVGHTDSYECLSTWPMASSPSSGLADIGWSKAPTINHTFSNGCLWSRPQLNKDTFITQDIARAQKWLVRTQGHKTNLYLDNVNPWLHKYIRLCFTKYNLNKGCFLKELLPWIFTMPKKKKKELMYSAIP